jgi:hypothetical protein
LKVVVNRCYGGFGLSPAGLKLWGKRKGFETYFYEQTKYEFQNGKNEYKKLDNPDNILGFYAVNQDLGEKTDKIPDKSYIASWDMERNDPDLVAVVEELGDLASGQCSNLKVVEIPDDIQWEISDYDGMERVEECHRSW